MGNRPRCSIASSPKEDARVVRVPSHLEGWVFAPTYRSDLPAVEAAVRCPCGGEVLECHYPGACHLSPRTGEPIPCTAELREPGGQGRWCFAVKAVCVACRR